MPTRLAAAIAFLLGVIVAVEAATTVTVGQHGMVFTKSSASLARGDRIVFTNEDDVIHNIHIFGPGNDESTDLGLQNYLDLRQRPGVHALEQRRNQTVWELPARL